MVYLPTVVPAECIEYFNPDLFSRRCTSATSFDTDAVGVPIGTRQKSAVQEGGVARVERSADDVVVMCGFAVSVPLVLR